MTAESIQAKLTDEDIKKMLEKFDIDKMMKFLINFISMLGEIAVKFAEIEEENKEVPELIKIISTNPRPLLNQILEKASGDEVKTLMLAMIRLDELGPKLSNLFALKAEEKKQIGEELINLSKEIEQAYKKAREKR
jgi:hypothetical protein